MPRIFQRFSLLALIPLLALVSSCENKVSIDPDVLAGSYTATSFIVTQTGQPAFDVLAKGGSLTLTIAANDSTSGTLVVPSGFLGGSGGTANMAGKVVHRSDGTLQFNQVENTFVSELIWQQFTDALVSTSFFSNTQFQVTLRK